MLITIIIMALLVMPLALLLWQLLSDSNASIKAIGASVILLSALGAIGLYANLGAFGVGDMPLKLRSEEIAAAQKNETERLNRASIELESARLFAEANPKDIEAQFALAEAAALAGDSALEIKTLRGILALTNEVSVKSMIAEALSREAQGIITPAALDLIEEVLREEPHEWRARYLKGLYLSQSGDDLGAFEEWQSLAEDSQNEPFLPIVMEALSLTAARLGIASPSTTLSPDDMLAMIENLEARLLSEDTIDHEAWLMLIRSYVVLEDSEKRDARINDMLLRLKDSENHEEAVALMLGVVELLLPPDNLPTELPAILMPILEEARALAPHDPAVLFFSGLEARHRNDIIAMKAHWRALRPLIANDAPLAVLIDSELAKH